MEHTNINSYSEEELENSISYVVDFYCRKYANNKVAREAISYLIKGKIAKHIDKWDKNKSTLVSYCSVLANTAIIEYLAITPVVRRTVNDEKLTILSIEDNEAKQLSVDDDIIEKYDSVLIRNSLEQILLTAGNISYEELELLQLRYGLFDVDSKNIATIKNSTGKYWRSQDAMLTIIFKKLRNNEGIITLFKHLKS